MDSSPVINKLVENAIESVYREFEGELSSEYVSLYKAVGHQKLQIIFSTLHNLIIKSFVAMNTRLPTDDSEAYYWADNSRDLIRCIECIDTLKNALTNSSLDFIVDEYYSEKLHFCSGFLQKCYGSTIPPHTEKMQLYYSIPIFIPQGDVSVDTPEIREVDRDYILTVAERANKDIADGNFDSAITKCRTLLEEVFCYVIEKKGERPDESGDIGKLYKGVKDLYNMHASKEADIRINKLLSGLEKIVSSIAEMRNIGSDSHGVGDKRFNIEAHHARLFVNSATTMADFILSVENKQQ